VISKFFIHRPIFAIVIALMISIIGLLAMVTLPVAKYPKVTPPQVYISATYSGANADVIGTTVASVIEQQLIGVEHLVNVESSSTDSGSYRATVQFTTDSNGDMDTVNTQNKVSQVTATLPTDVQNLGVTVGKSSSTMAMVFSLVSPNSTYDQVFMKNYATQFFMDAIKAVPGVGDVTEFGSDYAMRIWLDPAKMAVLKIVPTDISSALTTQNVQAAVGTIGTNPIGNSQQYQYTLRTDGRLKTADEFKKIIIRTNSDGSMIHLGDVATVQLGAKSYSVSGLYNENGKQISTAGFQVSLTSDANAVQTVSGILKVLKKAQESFPPDLEYRVIYDSTEFVKASITEVIHTFIEALLLVAFIVFVFLQSWRSTFIPLIAVPVSLLGTFAAFQLLGFSINTLTLFAMVLAIGLLVDDAIVVIEAVEYEIKYHARSPIEATEVAMRNVQNPVIGVACVLSAVFVPVSFLSGMSGILYRQFALTIAVSVMISAFVALTLTPALCGMMLKVYKPEEREKGIYKWFNAFNDGFDRLINWYGKKLAYLHIHIKWCVVFLVLISTITAGLFNIIPTGFVPSEDNGFAIADVTLPEGTSQQKTEKTVSEVANWIAKLPNIQGVMGISGYGMLAGAQKPNSGAVMIK